MKSSEAVKGIFVKWYADRMFKGWDTYGKVIDVTDNNLTIKTFDDFKETTISKTGESWQDEITIVSKDDVVLYIENRKDALTVKKLRLELDHKREIKEIENQINKLEKYEL